MSKMMKEVKSHDIPVVGEDYLADAAKGGALLKIPSHTISSWGAPRYSVPSATDEPDSGPALAKSKGQQMILDLMCRSDVQPFSYQFLFLLDHSEAPDQIIKNVISKSLLIFLSIMVSMFLFVHRSKQNESNFERSCSH